MFLKHTRVPQQKLLASADFDSELLDRVGYGELLRTATFCLSPPQTRQLSLNKVSQTDPCIGLKTKTGAVLVFSNVTEGHLCW